MLAETEFMELAARVAAGAATEEEARALEPYKVDNAIIMAAGLSSRFAPISYEKPKGVLKVRGEILIERQIRQLRDAGIEDIYVVVGYKKEHFFYLEKKLGVTIVVNNEYARRNNNSSLMAVKDKLGNSYICSSDDYFLENPFESHVYKAYYAGQHSDGPTEEWVMHEDEDGRIRKVDVGGADEGWFMIGHAYFDRAFSERFRRILVDEYDRPETADKLWEEIYSDHIDELDMALRKYVPDVCFEFDTLDEVREFDPAFIENVDSMALENISAVLGCPRTEIRDIYPLKQGLTNLSCHFRTDAGEFVYRHPGVGTEHLIDRAAELEGLRTAKRLGLDSTFIHQDEESGWKISRFLPNARNVDPRSREEMREAMELGRALHESGTVIAREFNFYDEGKKYERVLEERGEIDIPGYYELSEKAGRLKAHADADGAPVCLCHNDFFYMNFLYDEDGKLSLIDWEYAGMSDYASDFGTCIVCNQATYEEALCHLEDYFGRKPTFEEVRHNFAYVVLAGWCWYVWSLVKEMEGAIVGDWLYIYYSYADKYMDQVLSWYEEGEAAA